MLNTKKLLTKILSVLPLFTEVTVNGTAPALSSNAYFNIAVTGDIPSGYTPVAIKSFSPGTSNYYVNSVTLTNNGCYLAGRSFNAQSTTAQASAVLLCMKTWGGVLRNFNYVNLLTPCRKVVGVC